MHVENRQWRGGNGIRDRGNVRHLTVRGHLFDVVAQQFRPEAVIGHGGDVRQRGDVRGQRGFDLLIDVGEAEREPREILSVCGLGGFHQRVPRDNAVRQRLILMCRVRHINGRTGDRRRGLSVAESSDGGQKNQAEHDHRVRKIFHTGE